MRRLFPGVLAALALGSCQCVTLPPDSAFLCENGACPEGYVCSSDGYCDALSFDGGPGGGGGGGGGGAGGGSGGSGGGTVESLMACERAWCWEHPRPWGAASVNSVFTAGGNDAWVVGDNGFVFHWNGSKWAQGTSDSRFDLYDVWKSPDGEVWAVGRGGVVAHLEAGRFVDRGRPFNETLLSIRGTSGTDFWVAGNGSRIARYQAGVWADVPNLPAATNYADLCLDDPARMLVAGNALQQWNGSALVEAELPAPMLRACWAQPGSEAWVGGVGGALFKVAGAIPDAGTDWAAVDSGTVKDIVSLWGSSLGEVFYGASDGIFLNSPSFAGRVSALSSISAVHGTDSANVWASAFSGQVVRRGLVGGQFADQRQLVGATTLTLESVALNGDGTAFAVGDGFIAMHRNAAGTWTTVPVEGAQGGASFEAVWSDRLDRAIAVGDQPVPIAMFESASGTFKRPAGLTLTEDMRSVFGVGNLAWAGGRNTALMAFDGTAWSAVTGLPRSFDIAGIWGTAADNLFLVGANALVLHWDGTVWTVENEAGGELLGIGGAWPDRVYAVGPGGLILHRNYPVDGLWSQETSGVTVTFENVAHSGGVVFAQAQEGELMRNDAADGGWRRTGTTIKDGAHLWGISGAPGKGFLAVGDEATILRWTP